MCSPSVLLFWALQTLGIDLDNYPLQLYHHVPMVTDVSGDLVPYDNKNYFKGKLYGNLSGQ